MNAGLSCPLLQWIRAAVLKHISATVEDVDRVFQFHGLGSFSCNINPTNPLPVVRDHLAAQIGVCATSCARSF